MCNATPGSTGMGRQSAPSSRSCIPSLRQRVQLRHEREPGGGGRDGEDARQQQRQPQVADQVRQPAADEALHLQVQRMHLSEQRWTRLRRGSKEGRGGPCAGRSPRPELGSRVLSGREPRLEYATALTSRARSLRVYGLQGLHAQRIARQGSALPGQRSPCAERHFLLYKAVELRTRLGVREQCFAVMDGGHDGVGRRVDAADDGQHRRPQRVAP